MLPVLTPSEHIDPYGDLIIYTKPYAIYLRGTIYPIVFYCSTCFGKYIISRYAVPDGKRSRLDISVDVVTLTLPSTRAVKSSCNVY